MSLGPVQLLVVGFDRPGSHGETLAQFERLRESDVVRLIDLLIVHKDADGDVERAQPADGEAGVLIETLIGLRDTSDGSPPVADDEYWSLDAAIPKNSDAAIVLLEHRWAIGTRDAIHAAGASAVADAWIHPDELAAAGLSA